MTSKKNLCVSLCRSVSVFQKNTNHGDTAAQRCTKSILKKITGLGLLLFFTFHVLAQNNKPIFKVIAFYTAKSDLAHISFVHEANNQFPELAKQNHFIYDSTNNWNNLNAVFLSQYQVVLFLDTRPEAPEQRAAFKQYIENGGAWKGFSFCSFCTYTFCI